ncbi:DUF2911 domain-containing protein [Longitalea luteola]|uniref:DUF2911 domain-containing protein n=1 Tax=Longitalea luteola TaxID=2812563 RepID=UPI001A975558|nr:DUF2911 domain-containing protein [Longitalea luteola]
MFQTRPFIKLCCLVWILAIVTGCDHNATSGSNTVTINPNVTTTKPTEKDPQPGLDKSPMDMAYYPVDYPKLKMSGSVNEPPVARVVYSRPQKNHRSIFGDIIKYGSQWRLGANEASEIEFFRDVIITEKKVQKGRYVIYCIPQENTWTVVLNSDLYTWGLKIDTTKDEYKFTIPIEKTRFPYELFTMEFEKAGKGMQLVMEWDSIKATLPITW